MADQVKQMVQDKIKANKVMVFSKSYCPYCKKAKNVLAKYSIDKSSFEVMELDLMADQAEANLIQEVMKGLTGASSVPRVFVNGKFIGGGDDTEKLDKSGELKKLLVGAGAIHEEL
ncbi:putative Uncharacterized monothiol glutaredoxin F10D7.3 [Hypsibius exemplaris]|uniref:Glutaredoxin-2, mitochondrial n=1 Tax=Hypsibius exemplaris TaxID=2072580 RepID=A0A1W0X8D4_HYPEX|nr:putative Uncharacterized monothiol glutaredoxin F10D7.3 [Hypsibius exemplaris]